MLEQHHISISGGVAEAYYAGSPAWHSLGQVSEEALTSAGAMRLSHTDWEVEKRELFIPHVSDITTRKEMKKVEGFEATVRRDTGKTLGVVGTDYKVVQNTEAFAFMDDLLGKEGVKYEAAGAMKGGRRIWLLARIPGDIVIGDGDVTRKYMLLVNAHDGSHSIRVKAVNCRVVCWNTLQVALAERSPEISIRHTGNIKDKLRDAKAALRIAVEAFDVFYEYADALNRILMKNGMVKGFYEELIPDPAPNAEGKIDNSTEVRAREKMSIYYKAEARLAQRNNWPISAWTALNGATAWNTHGRPGRKDQDRRFASTMVGAGAAFSRRALNVAVDHFLS